MPGFEAGRGVLASRVKEIFVHSSKPIIELRLLGAFCLFDEELQGVL
jgi:hypothetical protein